MRFFDFRSAMARHTKILLAAGIVLFFPLGIRADAVQGVTGNSPLRLSPDAAVELAIRNNLGLEAARVSAGTARRASNLAWNQFIPSVEAGGTMSRLNSVIQSPLPQWGVSSSISATLSLNVAMFQEMGRLRLEYERGLISYGMARVRLERDIRKAYHNMLLLQENVALLHGSLENSERQAQIAEANFNAGRASELVLLQAQVARENLRPIIDQAESGLALSMMQFSMFLGLSHDTYFELMPVMAEMSPIPLDITMLVSRAASGQPDVQALRQEILIMNSLRQSGNLWLFTPTFSLGWNADPTFSGDPWNDPWSERDRWNQHYGAFSVSVLFRLNGLLPFGTERQGIRALEDQIRLASIGLAQMIRGTEIEIHSLVLELERIQLSMEAMKQTVALAERSFHLTEEAHRVGLVDLFQVQNAEQSLRQARMHLLEQQFYYRNGLLDLEYALGLHFGTLALTGSFD